MNDTLTIEQAIDYIFAAPDDQEFVNRASRLTTGHIDDKERYMAIHARVSDRFAKLLRAGIHPNYVPTPPHPRNPCTDPA